MTISVQNLTEAGFPLTLTYTTSDYCRYRLLAGGTPIISFSDAGHATRTLAAAHDLRIQTDNDGHQVFRLGEYITSSTYYPLTAITTALHQLADETREDIAEKFTVDPDDYDCDEDNLDDVAGPITAAVEHHREQLAHHVIGAVRDDEADGFTRVPRLEILQTQALCRIADALTNLTED